ncbi:MAG: relaxase/mobilization nuclease domain-containing protein [Clostridia bacterium]
MATTKLWSVKRRVDSAINYITNKDKTKNECYDYGMDKYESIRDVMWYVINSDKTEKQFYVSGINCKVENAVQEMQFVKEFFGKKKGILAFHGEQSFKEGEVTPELAHEIGVKLAEEMWGDRFQVVVTTHLNTKHIHNHFVLNSVSFKDGYKYYSNRENTALLRKTSDELCEEYGLSFFKEKTCKSGINFENYYRKSLSNSDYYIFAKEDIDYAIKHSYTTNEFHKILSSMGYYYYYRAGKFTIRKEPHKRNIRVERAFGEEYSEENIIQKILQNDYRREERIIPYRIGERKSYKSKDRVKKLYKPKGIVALYYYYRFLLGFHKKNNIQYKLTPKMREEVRKMDKYSEEIRFMCKYQINTIADIEKVKDERKDNLRLLDNERNRLYYKRNKLNESKEKDEISKEIINVTEKMKKIKKELWYCNDIANKSNEVIENIKYVDDKKWKKQKEKSKFKNKIR